MNRKKKLKKCYSRWLWAKFSQLLTKLISNTQHTCMQACLAHIYVCSIHNTAHIYILVFRWNFYGEIHCTASLFIFIAFSLHTFSSATNQSLGDGRNKAKNWPNRQKTMYKQPVRSFIFIQCCGARVERGCVWEACALSFEGENCLLVAVTINLIPN